MWISFATSRDESLTDRQEGVKQVNVQLSLAKREVLRGIYENYKKEHKYRGQV